MFEEAYIFGLINLLMSLIVSVVTTLINKKYFKFNNNQIISLIIIQITTLIIGGKIAQTFVAKIPFNRFDFLSIGIIGNGSLMLGVPCLILFSLSKHIKVGETLKLFMPSYYILYSVSKIGCFINGCCRGFIYNGPFSVSYIDSPGVNYFPIQIIEAIVFLILYFIHKHYMKTNKYTDNVIYNLTIISMICKGMCDSFRYLHMGKIISINQILMILIIIIIIIIKIINKRRRCYR